MDVRIEDCIVSTILTEFATVDMKISENAFHYGVKSSPTERMECLALSPDIWKVS